MAMRPNYIRTMGQRNDEINEQAAIWAAKIAGGSLSPDEQSCFDAWQAADIRHVGAFARAQAILLRVGRLRAVGGEALRASMPYVSPEDMISDAATEAEAEAASPPTSAAWSRRKMVSVGGGVLAAAGVAGLVLLRGRQQNGASEPKVEEIATRIGETRSVRLADGSVVTLNTDSKIAVSYTQAVRNIRLDRGEALFTVAKNKHRPFIVTASDTVVRAVGTSFTVRRLPERPVQVLVQEGIVEVAHRGARNTKAVRATAETRALVVPNEPIAVQSVPRVQVERNLAWRYGQISFENETLGEAASEFARYSGTKIAVDPGIANRTITGMYASNDPVGFAKAAASVLDLHVEVKANEVWIVR